MNSIDSNLQEWQIHEYEELDRLREESMLYAEKHCRKLKMGGVRWSPALQQARNKITYYTLSYRRLRGRKLSSKILQRYSKRTGLNTSRLDETELKLKIDEAYKQYKKLRKRHWKL